MYVMLVDLSCVCQLYWWGVIKNYIVLQQLWYKITLLKDVWGIPLSLYTLAPVKFYHSTVKVRGEPQADFWLKAQSSVTVSEGCGS